MFNFMNYADLVLELGRQNAMSRMTDEQFVVNEIHRFQKSRRFRDMINGENYYKGKQDILFKKRTAIGDKGDLIEVTNLPNNKIVDNQYKKMVDQKSQYLVGQPFLIRSEDQAFIDAIKPYIQTKKFMKLLKSIVKDLINCGIAWIYPHYDQNGKFVLTRIKPYEIIPLWSDSEHTVLESAIRIYEQVCYEGTQEKILQKVEVFNEDGIYYFELTDGGDLVPEDPWFQPYFTVLNDDGSEQGFYWEKIPLVPFRFNEEEIPLIKRCKSLQDGLNMMESQWQDQMEEDPRNTILVVVGYDGENLGEFRRNLSQYGAVKVRGGADGGDVRTLQIEVNAENYVKIKDEIKKAIIENCMGYDAKDDRLGGNANEMNIKSMYSDIELDTNAMETELQASFEDLIWFINCHMTNSGEGDFDGVEYEIIFNRDTMISEADVINNIKNSVGILSTETLIAQHPWVDDPDAELKKLDEEKQKNMDFMQEYNFGNQNDSNEENDETNE